jgi:hypothetical protein
MDNDVHSLPADQIGRALGAEVEKQRLDLRGKSVAEIASILTSPPIGRDYGIDEPLAHAPPVAPSLSPVAPDSSKLANAAPVTSTDRGIAGPKQHLDLRDKSVAEIVSILTSPPVGCEDGVDEPLAHAPPVAPASSPIAPDPSRLANALPIIPQIANAPPMAPGEVAAGEAARRFSHDAGPVATRFGRSSLFVVLAAVIAIGAIVAIGVTLTTFSGEVRKHSDEISGIATRLFEGSSRTNMPTKLARLVVKGQKGLVNEPLPLGVSINDASDGDRVVLAGFAIGTSLSTGTPLGFTGWQMLARDASNALVYPPKDFVGVMVAAVDLRSPGDWLIDSQILRLEWISGAQQVPGR